MGIGSVWRAGRVWIAAAAVCAAVAGGLSLERSEARARARSAAAGDLAALLRCLEGEPLQKGETLGGRLRGVELGVALAKMAREEPLYADGGAPADAGPVGSEPVAAPKTVWPARCAPFAEALGRKLDEAGDPELAALREALPTQERFALPYALLPDEAEELAAAIEKAGLPARKAENEPAPAAIAAPISAAGAAPLGKGRVPRELARVGSHGHGTDRLETRTMHLLVRDARTRVCALEAEGPAGPYGIARCGDLPPDLVASGFPLVDDGAPLAVYAEKEVPPAPDGRKSVTGILVLAKEGKKAIPINGARSGYDAYLAADGSYIVPAYNPLVRLGSLAALSSKNDLGGPSADRTVDAVAPDTNQAAAAYGMVFFNDHPPIFGYNQPDRRFWGRRVAPVLDPAPTDLGAATGVDLRALGGCRAGDLRALLFEADRLYEARVVLAASGGELRGITVQKGTSKPHLRCAADAVVVTSIEPAKTPGSVTVTASRCAGMDGAAAPKCTVKQSPPIALPAGVEVDAATFDGGVVLVWLTRADLVTSAARGMAFYKVAALDALADAPPRPLFEGPRRGGIDAVHAYLVARPQAAVVLLETKGKDPVTWAARIDASGAASAVRVEETSW